MNGFSKRVTEVRRDLDHQQAPNISLLRLKLFLPSKLRQEDNLL
jgi:hypothetical protein